MPAYDKPSGRDLTDNILARHGRAEATLGRLLASPKRSGVDRGDTAAVPAPFEGQTMIQYDTDVPMVYRSGAWQTLGGSGIQFDTYPQAGNWFYAEVTGSGGPDGWGWEVVDTNDNGVVFKGVPFLVGDVDQASNGAWYYLRSTGHQFGITGNQHHKIVSSAGTAFDVFVNFAGNAIGFFGVTPTVQPAAPSTLGDVIAALQALGLTA